MLACAQPPDLEPLRAAMAAGGARLSPALADTDFGRAVALSVGQSPRLARSQADVNLAQAERASERAKMFPSLSLGLGLPVVGQGLRASAALGQLVFDAGASQARRAEAEARVLGSQAGQIQAASAAALEAVQAWADVVAARKVQGESQAALAVLGTVSGQIAQRVSAGAGSSAEELIARSRLENQRLAIEEAGAELARALAVYTEVFATAAPPNLAWPPPAPKLPNIDAADSPTLRAAQAAELAALAQVSGAQAGQVGALSLQLTAQQGAAADATLRAPDAVASGGGRRARLQLAMARAEALRQDTLAKQREMQRSLNVLVAQNSAAQRRVAAAQRAADANREYLAASRALFQSGQRSLTELLDTEREALAAQVQLIQAQRDAAVLGYAILASTGDILDVFAIALPSEPADTPPTRPAP